MPDFRELFDAGPEEAFRTSFAGLQKHLHTSMVAEVAQDSDGRTVVAQPTILQQVLDPTLTTTTYEPYPLLVDLPVHFPGSAGATLTHGIAKGDELRVDFMSRAHDAWFQNGGTQQPIADRTHSLSDGIASVGLRSIPRALQQIATDALHLRDDTKHAVHEVKPGTGVQSFHADPSTAPASASFDPLASASKFLSHAVQAARGIVGRAVDGGTEHSHGVDHGIGAWMKALAPSGLMQVLAHPALGSLLSAADGKHSVTATSGGVILQSPTSISFACPPGGLSLPSGGVSAGSLAQGAASSNVGNLSGDLSGSLPAPQVVALGNVDGRTLPAAANDAAAAAAGVQPGGLYRNTAALAGVSLLAVRMV